jgi:hypothetical protein
VPAGVPGTCTDARPDGRAPARLVHRGQSEEDEDELLDEAVDDEELLDDEPPSDDEDDDEDDADAEAGVEEDEPERLSVR